MPPSKKWGIKHKPTPKNRSCIPWQKLESWSSVRPFPKQCVYLHDCGVNAVVWNYTLPTDQPAFVAAVTELRGREGGGGVIPTSDHHCSCWKRFLRLVPTWDLFILCRLFIKHIINQSGQTTFMITDVNLFLIIDMSYFFLWFAYCVYISSTQTMGAKECILLPLPPHPPTTPHGTGTPIMYLTFGHLQVRRHVPLCCSFVGSSHCDKPDTGLVGFWKAANGVCAEKIKVSEKIRK